MKLVETGHLDILKLIIRPDFKNESKQLPFGLTKRLLHMRNDNGYTCLHLAASEGNIK